MSHNWSVHTDPNETITVEAFDDLFITIIYGKCWRVREEKRRDFAASVWWEAENSRVEHLAAITRRHSRARSRHLFSYSSGSAEFIPLAKLETVEDERPNDERPTKNKPRSKPRFFIARCCVPVMQVNSRTSRSVSITRTREIQTLLFEFHFQRSPAFVDSNSSSPSSIERSKKLQDLANFSSIIERKGFLELFQSFVEFLGERLSIKI